MLTWRSRTLENVGKSSTDDSVSLMADGYISASVRPSPASWDLPPFQSCSGSESNAPSVRRRPEPLGVPWNPGKQTGER